MNVEERMRRLEEHFNETLEQRNHYKEQLNYYKTLVKCIPVKYLKGTKILYEGGSGRKRGVVTGHRHGFLSGAVASEGFYALFYEVTNTNGVTEEITEHDIVRKLWFI